jgi:hypothetical protein
MSLALVQVCDESLSRQLFNCGHITPEHHRKLVLFEQSLDICQVSQRDHRDGQGAAPG